jgi:hypothetical protein
MSRRMAMRAEDDIGDDVDDEDGFMSDGSSALTDLEEKIMSEAKSV